MLGVLSVLLLLALPRGEAAAAQAPIARDLALGDRALGDLGSHADEDGTCEEIEPQELLECGAQYDDMLDQPLVLSLLRALGVHMTAAACNELLVDVWAQQICEAGSLECGKMNASAPPGPPPKLVSSSASGHSSWMNSDLPVEPVNKHAFADRTRVFGSRDLQPPVPPPRCSGH